MKFLKVFIASITILSLLLGCCSCSVEYPDDFLNETVAEPSWEPWDDEGIALPKETEIINGEVQMDPPSDKLLRKIEKDYRNNEGYDTEYYITTYYGCYRKAIPVNIFGMGLDYPAVEYYYEVAGYTLDGSDGSMIYVWKNGKFTTLPKAYEQGILTKEDIDMMFSGNAIEYSYSLK